MIDYNNLVQNIDKQVFNTTSTANIPYTIGQDAFGGKVAYILQPGDPGYTVGFIKGLICTSTNISTGAEWGCNGTLLAGADGTAIGTGNQNTIDIMAGCATAGIAARICGDLVEGGFSDWYLPSKDELNKLYLNRVAIGITGTGIWWSSSESAANGAWCQSFLAGGQINPGKGNFYNVRAVRSFSEVLTNPWQTWTKPSGASTAYIVCIGAGGGGKDGSSGAIGTTRPGGGGGGSGSVTIAQVPFYSIPDTLYIQVGKGGIGGLGTTGGITYVSCYPTLDMFNALVIANSGAGGAAGSSGGAALSSSSTTNPRYLSLCDWASYAGQAGTAGGAVSPAILTIAGSLIVSGGAGGGGVQSNASSGGAYLTSGDNLTSFLKQGIASGNGYSYLKPFLFTGGGGGASGAVGGGNGANGGYGNIGSGGGGGGGGVIGGTGGNGGNGLVMIISY